MIFFQEAIALMQCKEKHPSFLPPLECKEADTKYVRCKSFWVRLWYLFLNVVSFHCVEAENL